MPCPIHKTAEIYEVQSGMVWFAVCSSCDWVSMKFRTTKPGEPNQAYMRRVVLKEADEYQKALPMELFGAISANRKKLR